jgi:hypothetical protein
MAASGSQLQASERESTSTHHSAQAVITSAAIKSQLELILSDQQFHNSKRYSSLIKFIVDRTLNGQHESLKERIIGIEVFGKPPDYDTALDSTVRVAATEVRRRLAAYYSEETHHNEIHIDLPTRSYVAEFKAPELKSPLTGAAGQTSRSSSFQVIVWIAAAVVICLSVIGLHRFLLPPPAIDKFWAPMLNYPGPVAISLGSGSKENPRPADISATTGSSSVFTFWDFLQGRQNFNFPITDVSAESALSSYLGHHGKECVLRFAQTTTLSELRGQPLILLGSFRNDWIVRFGSDFRFRFIEATGAQGHGFNWIEDARNPSDRKWAVDFDAPYEKVNADFALVTRAFDKSTGQWWIGIGGVTGVATLAAQQMLLDPDAMAALSEQLPKDWDRKNLQIVLSVKLVQGSPGAAQIVAVHSW